MKEKQDQRRKKWPEATTLNIFLSIKTRVF